MPKYELPDTIMVTVVSRFGKRVFVEDMMYGEALGLLRNKDSWKHTIYQQGFTSVKSNTDGRGFSPIPIPPPL